MRSPNISVTLNDNRLTVINGNKSYVVAVYLNGKTIAQWSDRLSDQHQQTINLPELNLGDRVQVWHQPETWYEGDSAVFSQIIA